jgi:hypothetical protein
MEKCKNYETCDDARKYCRYGIDCFEYGGEGDDDMSYYCHVCGIIVPEEEVKEFDDDRGYYGSQKVTQREIGCPTCDGDLDEAVVCEKCKEDVPPHTIMCGICSICADEAFTDTLLLSEYVNEDDSHYLDWCIEWWKSHGDIEG